MGGSGLRAILRVAVFAMKRSLRTLQENERKESMGLRLPIGETMAQTRQSMDEDGMCWSVRRDQTKETERLERELGSEENALIDD